MAPPDSQTIETATTAVQTGAPDAKTRRYDRQLRLWAATGQAALESARVLVVGASATSTSILKNLVLPGIGHFTVLDPLSVSGADAGNNFFLDGPSSIGKNRAQEAVPLLLELNDGVEGKSDTRSLAEVIEKDPEWILGFTLVIAHNVPKGEMDALSALLWAARERGPALITVRSAGFLAEFGIQFDQHDIIESHSETAPSLRLDSPFPALLDAALAVDFDGLDETEHAHIPYALILVRAMHDWKAAHDGQPPKAYADKNAFKDALGAMKKKPDEENFDEALAQAYRTWSATTLPSSLTTLFDSIPDPLPEGASPFTHLVAALKKFVAANDGFLPVTASVPDMKADTTSFVALQRLYRAQADKDAQTFKTFLAPGAPVNDEVVALFLKNAHAVQRLTGVRWGTLDQDKTKLAELLQIYPRETATHLAITSLWNWAAAHPAAAAGGQEIRPSAEEIETLVRGMLTPGAEVAEEEISNACGEIARAPTADLPNVAAFLGGLVAQEAIKMITKQYVPIAGVCVADLVETWTGVLA